MTKTKPLIIENKLTKLGVKPYRDIMLTGSLSRYYLYIMEENKDSFLVTEIGDIAADNYAKDSWKKEVSRMGSSADSDGKKAWFSKTDTRIAGTWIKMVSYNDNILRVIEEKENRYMVIATRSDLDKDLDMIYIEDSNTAYKWILKSDAKEL